MVPHANASVAHMEIRQAALRMIGLAVVENITHSSQRSNQGSTPIRVYLPAKTVDVYVHDVGVRLDSHTPDFVEDHGPRDDPARISTQIFQQNEFLRRQIQDLSVAGSFTPKQIEFEIQHSLSTITAVSTARLNQTVILRMVSGSASALGAGGLLIDTNTADAKHLSVGAVVPVTFAQTGT